MLLNARESNDPKIFLKAYRGLLHVELEKTHIHGEGLEYESHLELAKSYGDKANEVVRKFRDLLGRGNLSRVQFDRASITKREGRLKQRRLKVPPTSLSGIWNQAFDEFNRVANDLGKIENLPVDLLEIRIRALYEAGRMADEMRGIALTSPGMSSIPEEGSGKDYRLSGETLLAVPDPSSFYSEALGIVDRFRRGNNLSGVSPADLEGLTQIEEQIRSSLSSRSLKVV